VGAKVPQIPADAWVLEGALLGLMDARSNWAPPSNLAPPRARGSNWNIQSRRHWRRCRRKLLDAGTLLVEHSVSSRRLSGQYGRMRSSIFSSKWNFSRQSVEHFETA
jgi:hypothetical protein